MKIRFFLIGPALACGLWLPSTAIAQDSWATMSAPSKGEKKSSGEFGSLGNDFNSSERGASGSGSDFSGGDEFGVEDENIFGDDPLNSSTPSNSPEEVSGNSNASENNFNDNPVGNTNTGSPAQENASNFNFNNNENLNKQSTNAAQRANNTLPASDSSGANTPITNGLNAIVPASNSTGAAGLNNSSASLVDSPTVPAPDQPAPLAEDAVDPGFSAPTIPLANDFSGAPPIPGTRRIMADGEAPIEYSVESGDTLYDVCDQLLDEGGYWPKLWSLNPEIKNPHFIYPGMKLRFYPGDSETVPFLEVVSEEDVVPMDKGPLVEKELIAEDVPIRADRDSGVAEAVPELIRSEDLQVSQETLDMFMVVGGRYGEAGVRLTIPGFIFASEKAPEGFVIGGKGGRVSVPEGHKVIVEQTGSLAVGTNYTVLRPFGRIDSANGDSIGFRYSFVAHVKISALEDGIATASVTESRLGVQEDDILVSYLATSRTVDTLAKGAATSSAGEIVGFDENRQSLGRQGGFVFVSKNGVSVGQFVPVFRGPGYYAAGSEKKGPKDIDPVGQIRIIDASGGAALGIITESLTGLKIGDTLQR